MQHEPSSLDSLLANDRRTKSALARMQVSNLDHLFLCARAIINALMLEASTSSLSFRFSELSQPIWSLLTLVPQLRKEQFMKKIMSVLLMGFIGLVGTCAWAGSAREDTDARLQSSVDVLHAIMATPDKGIPEEVLSNAKCILVVPNLIKGGFIFGGKHGRGVATCRTDAGWSAPAFVSVSGEN